MMRVLVTGAAGLLGCNIVRVLIQENHKPVCLIRKTTDTRGLEGLPCDFVYGSLENIDEIRNAMEDCDAVIHAASIYTDPNNDYGNFEKINIQGTIHLVQAALEYGVKKFVYVSTANTLAPGNLLKPGTELDDFNSFHVGSHYLNSKYIAEQFVLEQVERKGLNAVVVHPTFMLGAYDNKPSSGRMILHGLNKRVIFIPPGGKNFVHVRDVAYICVMCLSSYHKGDRFLVAGENLTYRKFYSFLCEKTGQKSLAIVIPKWLLIGAAYLSELVMRGKTDFNLANVRILGRDNYYNGKKAYREFSYQPTPFQDTLDDALTWFSTHSYFTIKKSKNKELEHMDREPDEKPSVS